MGTFLKPGVREESLLRAPVRQHTWPWRCLSEDLQQQRRLQQLEQMVNLAKIQGLGGSGRTRSRGDGKNGTTERNFTLIMAFNFVFWCFMKVFVSRKQLDFKKWIEHVFCFLRCVGI